MISKPLKSDEYAYNTSLFCTGYAELCNIDVVGLYKIVHNFQALCNRKMNSNVKEMHIVCCEISFEEEYRFCSRGQMLI